MENKPYQGESLGIVFRCKNPEGQAVNLENALVEVFLIDEFNVVQKQWSTCNDTLRVKGNVVAGGLPRAESSNLKGVYRMEIKVTMEGAVMMDTVSGIRIWGTLTGGI